MKMLVLISGGENSAAAQRARFLLSDLGCQVVLRHRSRRKFWSLVRFVWAGIQIRPTFVYVIDTVWASVIAALVMKALFRCRFVLDTGDIVHSLARSTGRTSGPGCLAVWLVERIAILAANLVVVRGSYHRTYLRDQGIKRVVEIPECASLESANDPSLESQALELRHSLGLEHEMTVGVVGTYVWSPRLRVTYGWDLVEAMQFLDGLPVHAVIIGDGDGVPHLRRRIAELGLENRFTLLGPIPLGAINRYVGILDVCLSTQSDDRVGWARTASELPVYLANNRFVLATDVGQASYVLPPEMRIPYVGTVDREYAKRLAERIRAIVRSPEILVLGSKGRDIVRMHFDAGRLSFRLATSLGLPRKRVALEAVSA
jgi:glycosyltransferase involved in cell wall biosynthesis